ncbi:MAG: SprB repeat-containing protein, partial [Flavobacteriales bacterium]
MTKTPAVLMFLCFSASSYAVSVTIQKASDAPCGESLGYLLALPSGGTPPYSYQWSNGATTDVNEFLPPGTYSVTVTDGLGDTATDSEDILVTSSHGPYQAGFPGLVHCQGDDPYAFLYLEDPHHGPEPHTVQTPGTLFGNFSDIYAPVMYNYIGMWMDTPPGSWVTVDWTDGQGCPGTVFVQFSTEFVQPNVQITSVQGACGGSNGRINIAVTGVSAPQNFRVNIRTLDDQIPPSLVMSGGSMSVQNNTSFNFSGLAAGAYWIMTDPDILGTVPNDQGGQLYCVDSMYVEVPDLLGQCAQVSGSVFIDHDQDCVKDANDPGLSYRLIEFLPGSYYAIAGPSGGYSCYLPNGSYTMNVYGTGTDLYPVCPAVQPIPVVVSGANQVVNVADSSLVPLDLSTTISAGPARPGFVHNTWMRISNASGQASDVIEATLEFDPQMSFVDASPAWTSVVGNVVTWSGLPALTGFDHMDLSVQLQVPPDVLLIGQPFTHTFSVAQSFPESDAANNSAVSSGLFTASFDPNDKTARTSSGLSTSTYVINEDEWLDYTINFQNTGNDTAFTVMVRDVLPAELDMGTFEQGLGSHPFDVSFKPGRIVE